jgi:hypothetical protein
MMKLALVSTPRSGNTWLRHILANLYRLESYAVHRPEDLDWENLPENTIVQIHWRKSSEFLWLLSSHGFQIVTIARHPLDVLISILHFSSFEPQTALWLAGEGGGESLILGTSPLGKEFFSYASGPRAKAILSITPEWWMEEGVVAVRYEDLVFQPSVVLETVFQRLGSPIADYDNILKLYTLDKLRLSSSNQHYWKGSPGIWRLLLPAKLALHLAVIHSEIFISLNYPCDPDRNLVETVAQAAWLRLQDS